MAAYPCAHTLTINGTKKTFANSAEFKKYLSEGGLKELTTDDYFKIVELTGIELTKSKIFA